MASSQYPSLFGVVHLPPLAGSPGGHHQDPVGLLSAAGLQAVREARMMEKAGFHAVILENFGDAPFFKGSVPPETVASMAVLAAAVVEAVKIPVGINVLRNDARAALAIAAVTGAQFIRVNVLSGVTATDQGLIEGDAASLLRERDRLHAPVHILADVHVKHGRSLSSDSVELALEETLLRGGADAAILTGTTTGREVDPDELARAAEVCRSLGAPLLIGSGATAQNLGELMRNAYGVIVGSAIRRGGRAGAALDPKRLTAFAQAFKKTRKKRPSKRS